MRKILLSLSVLLSTVCAWGQTEEISLSTNAESPEHVYVMKSGSNYFMYSSTGPASSKEKAAKFAFFAGSGETDYKILCVDTKKWVSYTPSTTNNAKGFATLIDDQAQAQSWKATFVEDGKGDLTQVYQFQPYNAEGAVYASYMNWNGGINANNYSVDADQTVGVWSDDAATDAGSAWIVEEVLETVSFTYVIKYNGDTKAQEEVTARINRPFPASAEVPNYIEYTLPEGDVTLDDNGKTFDLVCTDDLPFTASSDYANAVWYTMKIRSNNKKYVAMTETAPYANVASLPLNEGALWAFSGNAFDGITVYNKMAGSEKTLGYDEPEEDASIASGANVYMKEGTTKWNIKPGNGGFILYQDATECVHDYGGNLQFWVDNGAPADPGSAFTVEPESDLVDFVADWKELTKNAFGFVGGYPASMETEVDEVSSFSGIISFETENASNKIELEVGAYYRFKNIHREKMLGANGTNRVPVEEGNDDVSQIWVFEAGSADGKYVIKNLNANKYMKNTGANDLVAEGGADYTLSALGYGQFNLVSGSNLVIYDNGGLGLGGWHENPLNSDGAWYIMPATDIDVVIGEAGYATTYLPFDAKLPAGLKAYAVTATSNSSATLTEKTDIKANQGAILQGDAKTYTLTIGTASSDWTGNMLEGSNVATQVTGDGYVLAKPQDKEVGLYKATLTEGKFLNNANKAYLPAEVAAGARLLFDFGTETAIESIEGAENADAVVYDLAGRRVKGAQKGLYIMNGKVVIK